MYQSQSSSGGDGPEQPTGVSVNTTKGVLYSVASAVLLALSRLALAQAGAASDSVNRRRRAL